MKLPDALNPTAIALCAILIRGAVDGSQFGDLDQGHKEAIVANGVEKMMRAGAFVQNGTLFLPPDATASDL
ncbi:hypothetical protein QCD71_16675 [Sphingomonas sp. PsM26]|nr:hypothetical protein [Sphingomonas sp. PsM26]